MNDYFVTGRLGVDPEPMSNGVSLLIYVRRHYKNKETGEYDTDKIRLKAFSKAGEYCKNFLKKGCLVEVKATIRNNNWIEPETNNVRYKDDYIVEHVRVLQRAQTHHEVLEHSY